MKSIFGQNLNARDCSNQFDKPQFKDLGLDNTYSLGIRRELIVREK